MSKGEFEDLKKFILEMCYCVDCLDYDRTKIGITHPDIFADSKHRTEDYFWERLTISSKEVLNIINNITVE
jgi:hypothetical protein